MPKMEVWMGSMILVLLCPEKSAFCVGTVGTMDIRGVTRCVQIMIHLSAGKTKAAITIQKVNKQT